MMIRYRLNQGVEVFLNTDDPNETETIQFTGDESAVEQIRQLLGQSYGAFGHQIDEATTPIDLSAALQKPPMMQFDPQLIEGAGLVEIYDPGVPDDVQT